jgi:hypothetical protein
MNWHIEHHMFAAVPCYNLKALHSEVRPYPHGLLQPAPRPRGPCEARADGGSRCFHAPAVLSHCASTHAHPYIARLGGKGLLTTDGSVVVGGG